MNAPLPATAVLAPARMAAPASIRPSPWNRKNFDAEALTELSANVAIYGVLQPILVRPYKVPAGLTPVAGDPKFELVFGERRWRAATAAKLTEIPVMVRELTDVEVVELQIIENQKREDVHPLEEAETYEHLLKLSAKAGTKLTPEEIGKRISKSRSYVYGVLKFLDLCPAARTAFHAGTIDRSRALAIARVSHPDLQAEVLKEVLDDDMNYRDTVDFIAENYMLSLKKPPFDPVKTYFHPAGRGKGMGMGMGLKTIAGPCAACPRRAGNMMDLFTDGKQDPDVCTDTKCFSAKRAAATAEFVAEKKKDGVNVITGPAAKKLKPFEHGGISGGYVSLEQTTQVYKGADYKGHESIVKLVGKELAAKTELLEDPHTKELVPVVKRDHVKQAMAAKGLSMDYAGGRSSGHSDSQKAAERKARIETAARIRILSEVREANRTREFGLEELQLVAHRMFDCLGFDLEKSIADAWNLDAGITKPKGLDYVYAFAKRIKALDANDLKVLLLDMVLIGECRVNQYSSREAKLLYGFALKCKVPAEKIAAEVRAEFAEKKKAKKKPAAKAAAKPAKAAPRAKPNAMFMTPLQPSAELAAVIGDKAGPRTDITKRVWAYIKKHDLQDKTVRKMINADDKLKPIFKGKAQISMFDMTKLLNGHLSAAKGASA